MNKYEEALNILTNIFAEFDQGVIVDITPIKYKKGFDSLKMFQELIEKENKYRWHDLRKNSNDLPREDVYVLTTSKWEDDYWMDEIIKCENGKMEWLSSPNTVIAWRYIEPFEVQDE